MNRESRPGKYRQRGSMGNIMLILLVVAGAVSMGTQLIPLYLDHNTMSTIMDKMSEENGLALRSDSDLREMMRKRMKLNNIRDFDLKEHMKVDRSGRGSELVLDYEVRVPLISNLDLIASFDKRVPLRD